MSRSRTLLLLATGAATVSVVCVVVSHGLLPKPPWLYEQVGGWTIYPPLSALPQAIPVQSGPTLQEYLGYLGLLAGASSAAVVALLFWVLGLVLAWKDAPEPRRRIGLKMLPLLLVIPCAIHLVGMAALSKRSRYQQGAGVLSSPEEDEQITSYDTSRYSTTLDSLVDAGD